MIVHNEDIIEHHEEICKAMRDKADEIKAEHTRISSWISSFAFGYSDIVGLLDVGHLDGTHTVYFMAGSWVTYPKAGPEVNIRRYYHNHENYWESYILANEDEDMAKRRVVINGTLYSLGKHGDKPSEFNGYGGSRFDIDFFDGRKVVTHDLWYQGPIPPVFRDRLPDNAKWGNDEAV